MAEKNDKYIKIAVIAIVLVIVVISLWIGISKLIQRHSINAAKSPDDIVISDKDSNEIKIKKIEKKIELVKKEIKEVQVKTEPEIQKLNNLNEEYVTVMNEYQTSESVTE